MDGDSIHQLLEAVAAGRTTTTAAAEELDSLRLAWLDGATVDLGRKTRCGFPEVIYGEGKPPEMIAEIAARLVAEVPEVLVTRVPAADAEAIAAQFSHSRYNRLARTLRLARRPITAVQPIGEPSAGPRRSVAVVTAGSTDLPVAEEAAETLAWMGVPVERADDLGVAGPQRLLERVEMLRRHAVIVVIAGMEGALPSVVGGHVAVPVIAVPTSVGYGAALGGMTAMLGMLVSCAANVAVVNIDAGFKGGYLAGLIATAGRSEPAGVDEQR